MIAFRSHLFSSLIQARCTFPSQKTSFVWLSYTCNTIFVTTMLSSSAGGKTSSDPDSPGDRPGPHSQKLCSRTSPPTLCSAWLPSPTSSGKRKGGLQVENKAVIDPAAEAIAESLGRDQGVRWVQIQWIFPHMPRCQDQWTLVSDIIHPPYLGCSARGHFLFCSQEHEEHHMTPQRAILSWKNRALKTTESGGNQFWSLGLGRMEVLLEGKGNRRGLWFWAYACVFLLS